MTDRVNIRLEGPKDYDAVEQLIFAAFETLKLPGRTHTNEHFLAHLLRSDEAFVPELGFVAELAEGAPPDPLIKAEPRPDPIIVGNILYSRCQIMRPGAEAETAAKTLVFGPVSVKPELHGQGIGSLLIRHSLGRARMLGFRAALILGRPAFYARFGFVPASQFNITLQDGNSPDAFMALELAPGALSSLDGGWGKWVCCKAFDAASDSAAFKKYNDRFIPMLDSLS